MRFWRLDRVRILLVLLLSGSAVGVAQMVTDGLVGYWPLDRSTIQGDTVQDVVGNNDGTLDGAPEVVPGVVGEALEFNGESFVDIPGTDALNFNGKDALTVGAWIRLASDNPVVGVLPNCCGEIVAQRDAEGWALRYDGRNAGMEMEFIVHSAAGWEGDGGFGVGLFPEGEWHYMAGVLDAANMYLYVDGELAVEQPFNGPTIVSTRSETEIGRAMADGGFVGTVDEVTIYDRALSDSEIRQNFQAKGLPVDPAGKLSTTWGRIKALRQF